LVQVKPEYPFGIIDPPTAGAGRLSNVMVRADAGENSVARIAALKSAARIHDRPDMYAVVTAAPAPENLPAAEHHS
jgi:hypothetical protein